MKLDSRVYTKIDILRIPFISTPLWTVAHILTALITRLSLLLQIFATSNFINVSLLVIRGEKSKNKVV